MQQNEFELLGPVTHVEVIATRGRIREVENLRELFGPGRWRKLKGIADIRFPNGVRCRAEVHWHEAHGIGRRKLKIKEILEWL